MKKIIIIILFGLLFLYGCDSKDTYVIKKFNNATINYTIINGTNIMANSIQCPNGYLLFNISISSTGDLAGICQVGASGNISGGNETLIYENECLDAVCETFLNVGEQV